MNASESVESASAGVENEKLRKQIEEAVKHRVTYRLLMKQATTETDKAHLHRERKRYVERQWYHRHRDKVCAKKRAAFRKRREDACVEKPVTRGTATNKPCCPVHRLGTEPGPEQVAFKLWFTKCKKCHRLEYGWFGYDQDRRVGVYFRGRWFKDIDPEKGTGRTLTGDIMSLTRME